jgi:hypothetical protein
MPRDERVHHYERPFLHDLSAHDRQAEPVALCESVAALVCAWHALVVTLRAVALHDPERGQLDDLCLEARILLGSLPNIDCTGWRSREQWITEAEMTAGFIMATVDMRP